MRREYLPSLGEVLIRVRIAVLTREKGIPISSNNSISKPCGTLLVIETYHDLHYYKGSVRDKTGSEAELLHQSLHRYSCGWNSKFILLGH